MRLGVRKGDSKESILPSKLPSQSELHGVFKAISIKNTFDGIQIFFNESQIKLINLIELFL
jgi:hypothetical protein